MGDKVEMLLPGGGLEPGCLFKSQRLVALFKAEFFGESAASQEYEDAAKYFIERSSRVLDILQQSLGPEGETLSQVQVFGQPFSLLDLDYTWDTAVLRPLLIADIDFILSEEYNSDPLLTAPRLREWMSTAVDHTVACWSDYLLTRFYTGFIINVAVREAAHVAAGFAEMLNEQKKRQALLQHLRQVETTSQGWEQNHQELLGEKLSSVVNRDCSVSYGKLKELILALYKEDGLNSEESWEAAASKLFGRQADRYFGQVAGTSILCDLAGNLLPATFEKLKKSSQWDVADMNSACSAGVYNAVEMQLRELQSASLACSQPMTRAGVHPLHRQVMQQFVDLVEGACETLQAVQDMLSDILDSSKQLSWTGDSCFGTLKEFACFLNSLPPVMRCFQRESNRMDHAFFSKKPLVESPSAMSPSARLAGFCKNLLLESGAANCALAMSPTTPMRRNPSATPIVHRSPPSALFSPCGSNVGKQPSHDALTGVSRSLSLLSANPIMHRRTPSIIFPRRSRSIGKQSSVDSAAHSVNSLLLRSDDKMINAIACQPSKAGTVATCFDALPRLLSLPVNDYFSDAHRCESAKGGAASVWLNVPATMRHVTPIELTSAQLLQGVQKVQMSREDAKHAGNRSGMAGTVSADAGVGNELSALQQQSSGLQLRTSCDVKDTTACGYSERLGWALNNDLSSMSTCGSAVAKLVKAAAAVKQDARKSTSSRRGGSPRKPEVVSEEVPLVKVETDKCVMPELMKEACSPDASPKTRLRLWAWKRCNGAKPPGCSRSSSLGRLLNQLGGKRAGKVAANFCEDQKQRLQ